MTIANAHREQFHTLKIVARIFLVSSMRSCVTAMQLNSLLLRVLVGCLIAAVAAAQTPMQLKVFRGTLVHSRIRTEMEVLENYLIGIDESNYGTVSCGTGVVIAYSLCTCYYAREKFFF